MEVIHPQFYMELIRPQEVYSKNVILFNIKSPIHAESSEDAVISGVVTRITPDYIVIANSFVRGVPVSTKRYPKEMMKDVYLIERTFDGSMKYLSDYPVSAREHTPDGSLVQMTDFSGQHLGFVVSQDYDKLTIGNYHPYKRNPWILKNTSTAEIARIVGLKELVNSAWLRIYFRHLKEGNSRPEFHP